MFSLEILTLAFTSYLLNALFFFFFLVIVHNNAVTFRLLFSLLLSMQSFKCSSASVVVLQSFLTSQTLFQSPQPCIRLHLWVVCWSLWTQTHRSSHSLHIATEMHTGISIPIHPSYNPLSTASLFKNKALLKNE